MVWKQPKQYFEEGCQGIGGGGGSWILVKDSIFSYFSVDIIDKNHEDILWVSFTNISDPEHVRNICSCYLPPVRH